MTEAGKEANRKALETQAHWFEITRSACAVRPSSTRK